MIVNSLSLSDYPSTRFRTRRVDMETHPYASRLRRDLTRYTPTLAYVHINYLSTFVSTHSYRTLILLLTHPINTYRILTHRINT